MSAVGMAGRKAKTTYTMKLACRNCGDSYTTEFPKGRIAVNQTCRTCGCLTAIPRPTGVRW